MDAGFSEFMREREEASRAFVNGQIDPLLELSAQSSPATIFGPKGDCVQGAQEVNAANAAGARMFDHGSSTNFEVMHSASTDDIGYWTGIQRAHVRLKGKPGEVEMDLRVTEIFRRKNGKWKLIHRHADALKTEPGV